MASTPSLREHPASALLSRAHSPEQASTIFRDKIQKRPLLVRPSSPDPKDNARDARRKARQQKELTRRKSNKPKPLSAKQKRSLGIYEIPKEQMKYEIYEPMNRMWLSYIREVLGISGEKSRVQAGAQRVLFLTPAAAGPMLASADFHGAEVEVVRSKCVGRVGLRGIVVKDQKFSFEIVTKGNRIKRIPKEHTIFKFEVPVEEEGDERADAENISAAEADAGGLGKKQPLVFELHGSQFENRAPDRANRKFKMHIDPDL